MRGKLGEYLKTIQLFEPTSFTATTATFGTGVIDTRDYDQCMIVMNIGLASGPTTLGVKITGGDINDSTTAGAITGGVFTTITSANDYALHRANILCKNYPRYLWLNALASAAGSPTVGFSAIAVLGKGDSQPAGDTLVWDLE